MDRSYEVADSSDWLKTPVAPLYPVEAALRCQVCKDFFDSPMITSCSHTFCSLCIRRCLTNDGKCPTCRTADQELRLRRNGAVEELVEAFQAARPSIIQLGSDLLNSSKVGGTERHKRRLDIDANDDKEPNAQRRKTRSQSHRSPDQPPVDTIQVTQHINENAGDAEYLPDDNMTACPICNQRMKEEDVFLHLDTHQGDNENRHGRPSKPSTDSLSGNRASKSFTPNDRLRRLPQVNYSILKDAALRKKLAEHGIPNWGARTLLIRRHTEWLNLWNANCDSTRPRKKGELLRDLEVWERTQGGHASGPLNGGNSVMRKDFDGSAWAANHGDDFQRLIARARQKPDMPSPKSEGKADDSPGEDGPKHLRGSVTMRITKPRNSPPCSDEEAVLRPPSSIALQR